MSESKRMQNKKVKPEQVIWRSIEKMSEHAGMGL